MSDIHEEMRPNDAAHDAIANRIRAAMADEDLTHYSMSLTDDVEIRAIIEAVNVGIDSHLTACYCPDRGDSYQHGDRSITATSDTEYWHAGDKLIVANTLECHVSAESLPVLMRRLDESAIEAAWSLRAAILSTLNIEE